MREQLPIIGAATATKLARPWSDAAETAGCAGTSLPFVWIAGTRLCPVVVWDRDLLDHRIRTRHPPELDRSVLQGRLCNDIDHWVPAPLRMEAFIAVGPLRRTQTALGLIACAARPIAAVPAGTEPDLRWEEETVCDFYGFDLVESGSAGAQLTAARHRVTGRGAPKHPAVGHQRTTDGRAAVRRCPTHPDGADTRRDRQ